MFQESESFQDLLARATALHREQKLVEAEAEYGRLYREAQSGPINPAYFNAMLDQYALLLLQVGKLADAQRIEHERLQKAQSAETKILPIDSQQSARLLSLMPPMHDSPKRMVFDEAKKNIFNREHMRAYVDYWSNSSSLIAVLEDLAALLFWYDLGGKKEASAYVRSLAGDLMLPGSIQPRPLRPDISLEGGRRWSLRPARPSKELLNKAISRELNCELHHEFQCSWYQRNSAVGELLVRISLDQFGFSFEGFEHCRTLRALLDMMHMKSFEETVAESIRFLCKQCSGAEWLYSKSRELLPVGKFVVLLRDRLFEDPEFRDTISGL